MQSIHLKSGDWACEIDLQRGGALSRLTHLGKDVIEPSAWNASEPEACLGLLALIPCVHHASLSELKWTGTGHPVLNTPQQGGSLDWGVGWQSSWQVLEQEDDFTLLSLEHRAEKHWPWLFDASQAIRLKSGELFLTLSLTNQSSVQAPAGLGWAFTLPIKLDEQLQIDSVKPTSPKESQDNTEAMEGAEGMSQTGSKRTAYAYSALQPGLSMGAWNGHFSLRGRDHQVDVHSNLKTLHAKLTKSGRGVVFKALDQPLDVVNHMSAPKMLAPGESISVEMRLKLGASA